jgi:hypothetical protein
VRFQVLIVANTEVVVCWVVASCSPLEDYHPDDGDSRHLRNIGKLLPDYMIHHPRRQPSSGVEYFFFPTHPDQIFSE